MSQKALHTPIEVHLNQHKPPGNLIEKKMNKPWETQSVEGCSRESVAETE